MSRKAESGEIERRHYVVDEAGDPTLFEVIRDVASYDSGQTTVLTM